MEVYIRDRSKYDRLRPREEYVLMTITWASQGIPIPRQGEQVNFRSRQCTVLGVTYDYNTNTIWIDV